MLVGGGGLPQCHISIQGIEFQTTFGSPEEEGTFAEGYVILDIQHSI